MGRGQGCLDGLSGILGCGEGEGHQGLLGKWTRAVTAGRKTWARQPCQGFCPPWAVQGVAVWEEGASGAYSPLPPCHEPNSYLRLRVASVKGRLYCHRAVWLRGHQCPTGRVIPQQMGGPGGIWG